MHSMRAQLSLYFTDEELYNNLIQPERLNKTLQDLVKRLLASYYYNDKVRELVDSGEVDSSEDSSVSTTQQLLNNIKSNLAMFQFQTDALQDVVSDGAEYFQDKGSEDTEFGATVPKYNTDMLQQKYLEMKGISPTPQKEVEIPKEEPIENPKELSPSEARLNNLEKNMELILRKLGIMEDEGVLQGTSSSTSTQEPVVTNKNVTQTTVTEVKQEEPVIEKVSPVVSTVEEPVKVEPKPEVPKPVERVPEPVEKAPEPEPVEDTSAESNMEDMEEVDSDEDYLGSLLDSFS